MWDHLLVKPEEDPEARIRQLEQPLENVARASEQGAQPYSGYTPPPPPQSSYDMTFPTPYSPPPKKSSSGVSMLFWVIGLVAVGLIVGGGIALFFSLRDATSGVVFPSVPSAPIATGGAPAPGGQPAPTGAPEITVAPGGQYSIGGLQEAHVIACNNGGTLNISGVQNNITVTGHCGTVSVSGVKNTVTVDSADSISASGVTNKVTYHSGNPEIDNFGDNLVGQG